MLTLYSHYQCFLLQDCFFASIATQVTHCKHCLI